jgi:hypothetical protein
MIGTSSCCFKNVLNFCFVAAVIIILKHATFLYPTNSSQKSALTQAEKDYQAVNMEPKIHQFLSASTLNHSIDQVVSFIKANDIGLLFLLPFTYILSSFLYYLSHQLKYRGKTIGLNCFRNQYSCKSLLNSTREDQ